MRFLDTMPGLALLGLATSHAVSLPKEASNELEVRGDDDKGKNWHPQTRQPHFFNLRVNDRCDPWHKPYPETKKDQCPFDSYAIRLEKGILVATPYNKWWDPKLPTFFVDDDTQLYTVSKDPLQLYVDSVTGAVKYTKVGWLPPSAISTGWYHTGNNPIQLIDPSPSYLTWPSTYGITKGGNFALCPLGGTGQFQVFVNNWNFDQQGVEKRRCKYYALAALNANPWKQTTTYPTAPAEGGYTAPTPPKDGYSTPPPPKDGYSTPPPPPKDDGYETEPEAEPADDYDEGYDKSA